MVDSVSNISIISRVYVASSMRSAKALQPARLGVHQQESCSKGQLFSCLVLWNTKRRRCVNPIPSSSAPLFQTQDEDRDIQSDFDKFVTAQ
jgi:hypothetical protein